MKRDVAIAILAVFAATAFLFWPLLVEPRFFEWDVAEQYWPDLVYLCESAHRGELPYWNPYDRGGYPYFADPQAAAYHPTSWLICGIAGSSPALGWASARVVFGFALAGLFGLLWLRRLKAPWSAAIAGAVVIEAAPFMRHNWELNLTHALAYLPLMLWAADRLATEKLAIPARRSAHWRVLVARALASLLARVADGVMLALAFALCAWAGSPPALWLSATMTLLYLAFRLGEERRLPLAPLAAAIVFTIGLCGIVLVPAAELAQHSVQADRSFASIAEEGLTLERTLALLWPQPGNHLYAGTLALGFGLFALFFARQRVAYFMWALVIVAVLMAMGAHGPLFRFAFDHVPGVALFRLPHRYEAWLGPALGLACALGIGAVKEKIGDHRSRIAAVVLAVGGVIGLVVSPGLGPSMLAFGIAAVLAARTFDGALASAPLGVILAALVLADVSQTLPAERHTRELPDPCADRFSPDAPGTSTRWRVMDEFVVGCRAGTRYRRRDLRGYQDPLMLASYERVVGSLHDHPELAAQFNVRYALSGPHFIHGWDHHYLPRDPGIAPEEAMPFAYFVPSTEVERARDRQTALARTIDLAPSAIAIVEGMGAGSVVRRDPQAAATRVRLSPDRLSFTIDAPAEGVVVVNEAFYPGWRAWVDGEPARIHRANGFVRAIAIERGQHRVRMSFEPESGRFWRILLAISLIAALAVLAAHQPARRMAPSSAKKTPRSVATGSTAS